MSIKELILEEIHNEITTVQEARVVGGRMAIALGTIKKGAQNHVRGGSTMFPGDAQAIAKLCDDIKALVLRMAKE